MLRIIITGEEFYDEENEEFFTQNDFVLELEHSLISLSKWESKFEKPFLDTEEKTSEELFWYVQCMILNDDFPRDALINLSQQNLDDIHDYIDSKQSAT